MSSIDKRVVQMDFDNRKFEKNSSRTLKTLDKIDQALKFENADEGFKNIENAANNVNLDGVMSALNKLNSRFTVTGRIADQFIRNMTTKVMGGINNAIAQVKSGGLSRALNIEHAMFQFKALGINAEKAMESASYAVDGTAYGLDAAASVASQLGASGVKAGKDMSSALRAVSGVAAMTGSSYEDIGSIFTNIAGNGRVMSMQLMQLSSRGINAAAILGEQLGKTEAQIRDMVTHGQISFETFYMAMDNAFGAHAKDANKTFQGAADNVRAALSRLGQSFAQTSNEQKRLVFLKLIDALNKLKEAMAPVYTAFEKLAKFLRITLNKIIKKLPWNFITYQIKTIAKIIEKLPMILKPVIKYFKNLASIFMNLNWKTFRYLVNSLGQVLKFLKVALKPVAKYFKEAFITVSFYIEIAAKKLLHFLKRINKTGNAAKTFRKIFKTLVKIFDTFKTAIVRVYRIFEPLVELFKDFSDILSDLVDIISDYVTKLADAHNNSEVLENDTNILRNVVKKIVEYIRVYIKAFKKAFADAKNLEGVKKLRKSFSKWLEVLKNIAITIHDKVMGALDDFSKSKVKTPNLTPFLKVVDKLASGLSWITDLLLLVTKSFKKFGTKISNTKLFKSLDFSFIKELGSSVIELFAGNLKSIFETLTNFVKETGIMEDVGKGLKKLASQIIEIFKSINLDDLYKMVKIGALTGISLEVIAFLDALRRNVRKNKGIPAQLTAILENTADAINTVSNEFARKMRVEEVYLISKSIGILAASMVALSQVDTNALTNASADLIAVIIAFGIVSKMILQGGVAKAQDEMTKAVAKLAAAGATVIKMAGVALVLTSLAVAIAAIAGSFYLLSKIHIDDAYKSIIGMLATLAIIKLMMYWLEDFSSKMMFLTGFQDLGVAAMLFSLSTAIMAIAGAMFIMAMVPVPTIIAGGVALAGVLAVFGLFARLASTFNGSALKMAVLVLSLAAAINAISSALLILSFVDPEALDVGGKMLALVMAAFTGLIFVMSKIRNVGDIVGVILALSVAIITLTVAMKAISKDVVNSAIALGILAGSLVLMVGAMAIMGIILKELPELAVAANTIFLLTTSFLELGAGIFLVASSFKVLGEGLPIFVQGLIKMAKIIDGNVKLIAKGIANLTKALGYGIIDGIVNLIPKAVNAMFKLMNAILDTIIAILPKYLQTLKKFLMTTINFLINFAPIIIDSLLTLLIGIINGLAESIKKNAAQMSEAIWNLVDALVNLLGQILIQGLFRIADVIMLGLQKALSLMKGIPYIGKKFSKWSNGLKSTRKELEEFKNDWNDASKLYQEDKAGKKSETKDLNESNKKREKYADKNVKTTKKSAKKEKNILSDVKDYTGKILEDGTKKVEKEMDKSVKISGTGGFEAGQAYGLQFNKGKKAAQKKTKTKTKSATSKSSKSTEEPYSKEEMLSKLSTGKQTKKNNSAKSKANKLTKKELSLTKTQLKNLKKENKLTLTKNQRNLLGLSYSKKYKATLKYTVALNKKELKFADKRHKLRIRQSTWESWQKKSSKNQDKINKARHQSYLIRNRYIGKYSKVEGLKQLKLDDKQTKLIKKKNKYVLTLNKNQAKQLKLSRNEDLKIGLKYRIKLNKEQLKAIKHGKKLVFTNKQAKKLDLESKKNKKRIEQIKKERKEKQKAYDAERKNRTKINTRGDSKLYGDLDKTPVINPVISDKAIRETIVSSVTKAASDTGLDISNNAIKLSLSDTSINALNSVAGLLNDNLDSNKQIIRELNNKMDYLKAIANNTNGISNDIYLDGNVLVGWMDDSLGNKMLDAARG